MISYLLKSINRSWIITSPFFLLDINTWWMKKMERSRDLFLNLTGLIRYLHREELVWKHSACYVHLYSIFCRFSGDRHLHSQRNLNLKWCPRSQYMVTTVKSALQQKRKNVFDHVKSPFGKGLILGSVALQYREHTVGPLRVQLVAAYLNTLMYAFCHFIIPTG